MAGNVQGRGLSESFLGDLRTPAGRLNWLLRRVIADQTLCLEIRSGYINIYYRGGSLFKVTEDARSQCGYSFFFDPKYLSGQCNVILPSPREPCRWEVLIPQLKDCMDLWFGRHPKVEREFQQLVVRDNNSSYAGASDYFICDIEYDNHNGARFDLIGIRWPSTPAARRNNSGLRMVLIEMKHHDGAMGGAAGLADHLEDIVTFLELPTSLNSLKHEMLTVFNQKHELGLVSCRKKVRSFAERPEVLLLLANHDPAKSALVKELKNTEAHVRRLEAMNVSVRFIRASYCGFGIYEDHLVDWDGMVRMLKGDAKDVGGSQRD